MDGDVNATIRPQVTGYLIKQNYREGDLVKKGQTLFEIDPRTFQAAVDQADALRSKQQAIYETAKANLARVKPLAEKNAVSQKDLDDATGQELSARGALDQATAQLETARLNLGFTKITSPITGIAGIAKAQIGDLLSPSASAELTTVSTVDPIKVYVNISEREYLQFIEKQTPDKVGNVPLALILLALAEASGLPALALHLAGAALFVARVLHAYGLSQSAGHSQGRFLGVLFTWAVLLSLSLTLLLRTLFV